MTRVKINRKKATNALLITVIIISLMPISMSAPTYWEIDAGFYFKPTNSGPISFGSTVNTDQFYFLGDYVYFDNFKMVADGYTRTQLGVSVSDNANITITGNENALITYTVNAPTGNLSTSKIILSGENVQSVSGADSWGQVGNVLTVNVTHASPVVISITIGAGGEGDPTGSVQAADIWLSATETHYPPYYTSAQSGGNSIEDVARGAFVNTSATWETETWDQYVIESWVRVNKSTGDPIPAQMAFYEYVADGDAGSLYGNSSERLLDIGPGSTGYIFNFSTPVNIGPNYVFFVLINADTGGGANELVYRTHASGKRLDRVALIFPSWPDPLTNELSSTGETYHVRAEVRGENVNETVFNGYWGNATHYTARRDIDVTFPAGVSDRQINFTLPLTEKLANITYSNGDLWDLALTSSNYTVYSTYNATHALYQIDEAVIAAHGEDYRVYSETYDYPYIFYGPWYENGTRIDNATIFVYFPDETVNFTLDGVRFMGWDIAPEVFSFDLGNYYRLIYPDHTNTFYIFYPEDTYEAYDFTVRDYTAMMETDSYLESYRVVNGTNYMMERNDIGLAINAVRMILQEDTMYQLVIRFGDNSTYTFGYFIAGTTVTPSISITEISFSQQAQLTWRHITLEATKPTSTSLRVNYECTRTGTQFVNITVAYKVNGTTIHTDYATTDSAQFNLAGIEADTDYVVTATVQHSFYGLLGPHYMYVGGSPEYPEFPSFEGVFTFGAINAGDIFGMFLVFACTIIGTLAAPELGLFFGLVVAAVLVAAGGLTITYNVLALVLALIIGYALIRPRPGELS